MAPTHEFVQENPITFVPSVRRLLLAASACLLAACASTSLEGSWSNPALPREPISGPVLVVGVARDDIVRRVYEDGMVAQLAARGRASRSVADRRASP